eukprot:TRINITY_DN6676_c1_g1_i3.p1 TRINITY_DN6676_c1_g1~~TRINITY_DN6676_c1_g1_i3.p1  ORF type:complete len:589 (+),score=156.45 TRINITY_DN6676_c1_g1_i3:125-1768(+)
MESPAPADPLPEVCSSAPSPPSEPAGSDEDSEAVPHAFAARSSPPPLQPPAGGNAPSAAPTPPQTGGTPGSGPPSTASSPPAGRFPTGSQQRSAGGARCSHHAPDAHPDVETFARIVGPAECAGGGSLAALLARLPTGVAQETATAVMAEGAGVRLTTALSPAAEGAVRELRRISRAAAWQAAAALQRRAVWQAQQLRVQRSLGQDLQRALGAAPPAGPPAQPPPPWRQQQQQQQQQREAVAADLAEDIAELGRKVAAAVQHERDMAEFRKRHQEEILDFIRSVHQPAGAAPPPHQVEYAIPYARGRGSPAAPCQVYQQNRPHGYNSAAAADRGGGAAGGDGPDILAIPPEEHPAHPHAAPGEPHLPVSPDRVEVPAAAVYSSMPPRPEGAAALLDGAELCCRMRRVLLVMSTEGWATFLEWRRRELPMPRWEGSRNEPGMPNIYHRGMRWAEILAGWTAHVKHFEVFSEFLWSEEQLAELQAVRRSAPAAAPPPTAPGAAPPPGQTQQQQQQAAPHSSASGSVRSAPGAAEETPRSSEMMFGGFAA